MTRVLRATLSRTLFRYTLLLANIACANADGPPAPEFELPQLSVQFKVHILGLFPVTGRFHDVRGSFSNRDANHGSGLNITICPYSLDTQDAERDRLLRGPLFFDVARFPAIRFSDVRMIYSPGRARQLEGELTLNGVSQPVVFRLTEQPGEAAETTDTAAVQTARATINRSAFGFDAYPLVISDEVEITVYVDGELTTLWNRTRRVLSGDRQFLPGAIGDDGSVPASSPQSATVAREVAFDGGLHASRIERR